MNTIVSDIEALNIEFYMSHCCECEKPLRAKHVYICKPCLKSITDYQAMLRPEDYTVVATEKVSLPWQPAELVRQTVSMQPHHVQSYTEATGGDLRTADAETQMALLDAAGRKPTTRQLNRLRFQNRAPHGRCIQPAAQELNYELYQEGRERFIRWVPAHPEHRDDEKRFVDPVHDHSPDTFIPAPADLSPLQQIEFQDMYKLGGRVIGRHEAVVDIAWYLQIERMAKRLGHGEGPYSSAVLEPIKRLRAHLEAIDADQAVVMDALQRVKDEGIDVAIAYYEMLATELGKLDTPEDDALLHINTEGLAHEERWGSEDCNPEREILILEGIPSAAMIVHDVLANTGDKITLQQAGAIREDMRLQALDSAGRKLQVARDETTVDDEDAERDVEPDEDDKDFAGFVAEGWHTMDEDDDYYPEIFVSERAKLAWDIGRPEWTDRVSDALRSLVYLTELCDSIDELKKIGQEAHALKKTQSTSRQRSGFWAVWNARKDALLAQNEDRILAVRKGVQKILRTDAKELPRLGKRLYDLQKAQPNTYTVAGWTRLWDIYNARKASLAPKRRSYQDLMCNYVLGTRMNRTYQS